MLHLAMWMWQTTDVDLAPVAKITFSHKCFLFSRFVRLDMDNYKKKMFLNRNRAQNEKKTLSQIRG
jgi:hypothetical protein